MEIVEIGKAVKLHGFLGQIKINAKFDKNFDIKKLEKIYDENQNEYVVSRIFSNTDSIVVALENVDLEKAKTLIGKMFLMDRNLVSGKILIEDLKGSAVFFDDETKLGKVVDVQDFGAAEVFYVMTEKGIEIMFPNVKDVIISFDYKQKKLVINKKQFKEVCDYEN